MNLRRVTSIALALALAVAPAACGKSEQERQQEEAKKKLEQAQQQLEEAAKKAQEASADAQKQASKALGNAADAAGSAGVAAGKAGAIAAGEAAKGLEAFAKGLQGLAATGPDGKPVTPVNFHELQTAFVPLAGWEMAKPTGSQMASPVSYSTAEVHYTKGNAQITATVVDSGFNQLLLAPFTMFLTAGYEKETEHGYEKSVKLLGNPGWEKWDSDDKRGEVAAFIGKRFVVNFKGRGIDDTKVLYQLAESSNLAGLASLK
jgi:hypothetical protein